MRIWTYGEALDKIQLEMDLKNETFIKDDEYVGYFNDAVQKGASEIYKLGSEDEYFRSSSAVSLIQGTSLYSLPTDIFANKIREIVYANGTDIYPIKRLRRRNKALIEAEINQYASNFDYQYDIINTDINTGYQLKLYPPARETSSVVATISYIREAKYIPLVSAGSLSASRAVKLDMPEFTSFIFSYVRMRIAKKIPHPNVADFEQEYEEEKNLMIATLTGMVDDDNNEIEADMTHYRESN